MPSRFVFLLLGSLGLVVPGLWLASPRAQLHADEDRQAAADLEAALAFERHLQELIAKVTPAVVTVGVESDEFDPERTELTPSWASDGSGVVISADGLILTNDHVTDGQERVKVGLSDGREAEGVVLGRDVDGDVALIRIRLDGLTAAELGDSSSLVPGDPVLALGNPFGTARSDARHTPAASFGIVSATERYLDGSKVYGDAIQIDAAINPGNSGGPLFDMNGKLLGLNGRISVRGELSKFNVGVGFAIPIHQIALILADLEAGRDVGRGYLGVEYWLRPGEQQGALIKKVTQGSPAAAAGLRASDRIVAIEGERFEDPVRLRNRITRYPAGRAIVLTVIRMEAGREREVRLRVTLGKRPQLRRQGPR